MIDSGGASRWFDNRGTTTIATNGTLNVDASITIPQFDTGALTGGTWFVSGTLNLNYADAGIHTISNAARVVLATTNAVFSELLIDGSRLNTVAEGGTFGLYDRHVFDATNGLAVSGLLEFGLAAADTNMTNVVTGIDVDGDVDFTGGEVLVVDRGLQPDASLGDVFTVISWTGSRTGGDLVLKEASAGGHHFRIVHNPSNVQLVIGSAPGTLVMLR